MIKLAEDTIPQKQIKQLAKWLTTPNRQLTKGPETIAFEKEWSSWLGTENSVFVNSGSSANLLMFLALKFYSKLKNLKVIAPAVSWVTTIAPAIQLGFQPILCDCDENDLGLNLEHLKKLIEEHKPGIVILVHVLGHANKMKEIISICKENDIILLEDCCEAHGSTYNNQKIGTFGEMSSFSFYYGHHISTIEGGMVSTNNSELNELLLCLRSHGWLRDLPESAKQEYIKNNSITEFESMFTFLYPGLNIRSTDLNAFLGRKQLEVLDTYISKRNGNYQKYNKELKTKCWTQQSDSSFVSPLAFGLLVAEREVLASQLKAENIEIRPLVCGSIEQHPFWYKLYGKQNLKNATIIHNNGLYVPCHQLLSTKDIKLVSSVIKKHVEKRPLNLK